MKKIITKCLLVLTMILAPLFVFHVPVYAAYTPLRVGTELSDSYSQRVFTVYNPTNSAMTYQYAIDGKVADESVTIAANETKKHTVNSSGTSKFRIYDENKLDSLEVSSLSDYNVQIYFQTDGVNIKDMTRARCTSAKGASATAPATINYSGKAYEIKGNNYKEVSYGTEYIIFNYELTPRAAYTSNVVLLDQDGNILKKDSFDVKDGVGGGYTVPTTLNHNNRNYSLMDGYDKEIKQTYDSQIKNHYIRYQLKEDSDTLPYYVVVNYKSGDTLLTRKTMTVQSGQTVTHKAPETFNAGTSTYKISGNGNISHKYGDDIQEYTVQYTKYITDSNQPYDVVVNYIDLETGKVLEAHKKTVDVNKTIQFDIPGSVKKNDKTYILSTGQENSISHKFGTEKSLYDVYYHEKDMNIDKYDVTITYYNLTENTVLYTTKKEANVNSPLKIEVPSEYRANNHQYMLLSGQATEYEHEFYSKRRSYVVVYRDIDDLANQNVVFNPNVDGGTVNTPDGTVVNVDQDTGQAVITNPNGQQTVIDDNGNIVPFEEQETQVIDDNETPLANAKGNSNGVYIGTAIGVSALGLIVLLVIMKKRKNQKNDNLDNN